MKKQDPSLATKLKDGFFLMAEKMAALILRQPQCPRWRILRQGDRNLEHHGEWSYSYL